MNMDTRALGHTVYGYTLLEFSEVTTVLKLQAVSDLHKATVNSLLSRVFFTNSDSAQTAEAVSIIHKGIYNVPSRLHP